MEGFYTEQTAGAVSACGQCIVKITTRWFRGEDFLFARSVNAWSRQSDLTRDNFYDLFCKFLPMKDRQSGFSDRSRGRAGRLRRRGYNRPLPYKPVRERSESVKILVSLVVGGQSLKITDAIGNFSDRCSYIRTDPSLVIRWDGAMRQDNEGSCHFGLLPRESLWYPG